MLVNVLVEERASLGMCKFGDVSFKGFAVWELASWGFPSNFVGGKNLIPKMILNPIRLGPRQI